MRDHVSGCEGRRSNRPSAPSSRALLIGCEISCRKRDRRAVRRAIRGALPGVVMALERRTISDALAGDHAFKRRKPVTIVGLAPLPTLPRERGRVGRGAGPLCRLDFFAQHRGPLVPAEQPALMERHDNRKRLRLPRLAKYRAFCIPGNIRHGGGHLPSRPPDLILRGPPASPAVSKEGSTGPEVGLPG